MWMDFECETSLLAKMPETSQHFFVFSVNPGVYPIKNSMASFFLFFLRIRQANADFRSANEFSPTQTGRGGTLLGASFFFLVTTPLLFLLTQSGGSCGVREPRRSTFSAASRRVCRWNGLSSTRWLHMRPPRVTILAPLVRLRRSRSTTAGELASFSRESRPEWF